MPVILLFSADATFALYAFTLTSTEVARLILLSLSTPEGNVTVPDTVNF